MNQRKIGIADRVLAMLLSLLLLLTAIPVTAFAETPGTLTTNIDQLDFLVGEPKEFTFTTTANDDVGTMVKGSFVFSDPTAISKLEYYESQSGGWHELVEDFGPATGFPLTDATSKFRVTFAKSGDFDLTVSLKKAEGGEVLCSDVQTVAVQPNPAVLTTDIDEKEFHIFETTDFSFTTTANADVGAMVKGSFVFSDPTAISKLEYYESQSGEWHELVEDFGPATGFPLTDATSLFRVTFQKAGTFTMTASMNPVGGGDALCSCVQDVVVDKDPCTLTTDIENDQKFYVGEPTVFSFTTTPNDDAGTMVLGYFQFNDMDAIDKLEYKHTDGQWYEFNGAFGPAATGFPMSEATSYFRVTFKKTGNYTLSVSMKEFGTEEELCSCGKSVTVKQKFTVTSSANEGGTVTLDDTAVTETVVDGGTVIQLKVEADDGFQINSVKIGGVGEVLGDAPVSFNKSVTVSADTDIVVEFVKVYTVTVSIDGSDGSGNVVTDPANDGGSVTVHTGTDVTVTATPNANYRVSKVCINGEEDPDVSGQNDGNYVKTVTADHDYSFTVTFLPNRFGITVAPTEHGSVTSDVSELNYGTDAVITVVPDEGYVIDSIHVTGQETGEREYGYTVVDDFTSRIELDNVTDNETVTVAFKPAAAAALDDVIAFNSSDAVRINSDGTLYVFESGTVVTFETVGGTNGIKINNDSAETWNVSSWSTTADTTITDIRVFYQKSGDDFAGWHRIDGVSAEKPIRIVYDVTAPGVTVTPEYNAYEYYHDDVPVMIKAVDAGDFSGIQSVVYSISSGGVVTQPAAPLYTYTSGTITDTFETVDPVVIDASANNTANVKITVTVTDMAGNETVVEETVKINNVKPLISLDIDGEKTEGITDPFYITDRILTIMITDRDDTFSPSAVADGLIITRNGAPVPVHTDDIIWTGSDGEHIGTYPFSEEGTYTCAFSYINKAGSTNTVSAPEDKAIYGFTIDKNAPAELEVIYEPSYIGISGLAPGGLLYGFFKAPVKVTIKAKDTVSGIARFSYYAYPENGSIEGMEPVDVIVPNPENTDLTVENGGAAYSFIIDPQFRGKISFDVYDNAGKHSHIDDNGRIAVVDDIAPGVVVEYDPEPAALNGNYYNGSRTATISIDEANYFPEDVEDGVHLVIRVTKDSGSEELLKPTFVKTEENKYSASVVFDEDVDYTFDIKYIDRAGNVYDEYPGDAFVIDKIAPVINVSYSNNSGTNGNQFNAARTATVRITEHNFNAAGVEAAVKVNGVISDSYTARLKNPENWHTEGDVHTATLSFDSDGDYEIVGIDCTDLAGNESDGINFGSSAAAQKFTIDRSAPSDLSISYEPNFAGVVLENLTFGFYKAPVTVRLIARDSTTSVDSFTYSYTLQNNVSGVNHGKTEEVISSSGIRTAPDGSQYAVFDIPAQFRGYVSFRAMDKAGNVTSYSDSNVIIVDDVAPGVTVTYDNVNAKNGKYYDSGRKATITITEANFFEEDIKDGLLAITVGQTTPDGIKTVSNLKPTFSKNGDVYTAVCEFTEDGDYTFDISYTDRAGNVFDSYETDEFTIDTVDPVISVSYDNMDAQNGTFYKADRTATITVTERNFRADDVEFNISAVDVTGKNVDLSSKGYASYLRDQNNWVQNGNTWTAQIVIDTDGNYTLDVNFRDLAERPAVKAFSDSFCLDKSLPENLKISYNKSVLDCLIETISFGFYDAPVTVKIEASDGYAGIDHFEYSYDVEAGASETNSGKTNVKVTSDDIDYSEDTASAVFTTSDRYCGCVSFVVTDKAGNSSAFADEKVIVVDNVAPGVNVVYDNNNAKYDKYYDADRTATITITEANFFGTESIVPGDNKWNQADLIDRNPVTGEEYLVIIVGKTLNDGTHTETKVRPPFTKNGDVYTATILFNEDADYTFDIRYTDRSGNVYDSYDMDEFTIDKTRPTIELSYDNNTCKNGDQFKADRTATIRITEHNFIASDVAAQIKASGTNAERFVSYLRNSANWSKNGDVYTTTVTYSDEAHYEFGISCTDMAGNPSTPVDHGKSAAPYKFTLDKSKPSSPDITIGGVSVVGSMNTHAFNRFYDSTVTVQLSADFDISGMESLKYQKVAEISEYRENGTWLDYNAKTGIVAEPSEKFVIYLRAEDRAGNVSIIRSTGIVVDDRMPTGETMAPEIDIIPVGLNADNLSNGDVRVNLAVRDPRYSGSSPSDKGYYSGINLITYRIYTTDTGASEEGVLMDIAGSTNGAVFDADALVSSWSGSRTIDSSVFNSNNIIVEVSATDNAGNTRVSSSRAGDIRIDTVSPVINVSYDNNDADSQSYFRANRTATIVITERNFNSSDVRVSITNTDGVVPVLSDWTMISGNGNSDNTAWSATAVFSADGDYTFDITYTDRANNACSGVGYGASVQPTAFTIDKTLPTVSVTYDNNAVRNTNYYNDVRIATIVISEHNFSANRVRILLTASDDGEDVAVPEISAWTTSGDEHTATIAYTEDALYSFDIGYSDLAGNEAADLETQTFYVDKTAPSLEITGVKNESANNGDVIPVITYSDTNFDAESVTITLVGANRESVELDGTMSEIYNGQQFTFNDFAREQEIDDIYTLTVSLTDMAGNTSEQVVVFSVNRFGSTYALSDSAKEINETYIRSQVDVVITETNTDMLKDVRITMFKNNETIVLEEGKDFDYLMDVSGGDGQWYHYTYTVYAKNFEDDGVYRLTVYSEDAAGNVAENTLDTKNTAIQFGVDNTSPTITVANLDSGITYALENITVMMSLNDNLLLNEVMAYLDDYDRAYKTWNADEIAEVLSTGGEFTFDIPGDSTRAHKVRIVCTDAAGNETEEEITDFYVTTNLWVRYFNNTALFLGTVGGVIALAGLSVSLVLIKRKKVEKLGK